MRLTRKGGRLGSRSGKKTLVMTSKDTNLVLQKNFAILTSRTKSCRQTLFKMKQKTEETSYEITRIIIDRVLLTFYVLSRSQ